jgi:hypothetical protein
MGLWGQAAGPGLPNGTDDISCQGALGIPLIPISVSRRTSTAAADSPISTLLRRRLPLPTAPSPPPSTTSLDKRFLLQRFATPCLEQEGTNDQRIWIREVSVERFLQLG